MFRQGEEPFEVVNDDSASSKMKQMLDTVDKIRTTLGCLKNNQFFYEELLASLPQFVACGPQSAGKSSVIRRVSDVSLPEASTICTRIATIIQMRRSDEESTRVTLTGPDGDKIIDTLISRRGSSVRDVVAKAQTRALKLSKKQFVEDHTINVHVTGPKRVNVTLVDLPGFHTADDEDTKTVNAMVKRYVEMPGTLVLHVVKGDQDYASLLGNDFMRKAPKHDDAGRVTVLTHCDKINARSSDDVTRLRTTLDTTEENSTLTVALLGCAAKDGEEQMKLKHLTEMDHRLEVGVTALSIHLEERMREHLNKHFPKAVAKLETSLSETYKELESVRERSATEVLCKTMEIIRNNFRDEKEEFMNGMRVNLEQMTRDIKNFSLKSSKAMDTTSTGTAKAIDIFDEVFEPGQLVIYDGEEYYGVEKIPRTRYNDEVVLKQVGKDSPTLTVNTSHLRSAEIGSIDDMVKDIEGLALQRGMRNLVHADRQPIIAFYAKQFADHYTRTLEKYCAEVYERLDEFYNKVFSRDINDIAKPVADHFRKKMDIEISEARKVADSAIAAISVHNNDPDMIFSPNEHYLTSLVQKMVKADDEGMASDSGGARHIYHNIRAFIKVQRKYSSELASKEILRTTIRETGTRFHNLFDSNFGEPELNLINEPSKVRRKRETLLKQKKVLEEAIALAKDCN